MDQPSLIGPVKLFVRELVDGQVVDCAFEVRQVSRREKRNGEAFLKLSLGDVSGCVEAVAWDGVEEIAAAARPGSVVWVTGRYAADPRYGPSITLRACRAAAPEEYDPSELLERLLAAGSETGDRWRAAPAAKIYHQAYRHGLLEHSLSVASGVSAMASTFPGIDRDVAVAGALLHDIGKIEAYEQDGGAIDLSDAGRLQGEIPLGYYRVRRTIEGIEGFPPEAAEAVLHIVLSHHGKLEHGSPVTPCTREAVLVHMIDNLGGTLGSFDRIEKGLADGERWSRFDRALSGSAYFASRQSAGAARQAA